MVKKIALLLLFLGLGIFFIWFSVKDLEPEDMQIIKDSATGVLNPKSLLFIFISIVFAAMAHFFRALRNILLIDPLGYRVRKTTAFYSVMVCYLSNLAIPRLGEVLRCTFLQRYDKVPFQKSIGTIVVERVFDVFVFVLLLILVILLNQGLLSDLVIDNQDGTTLGNWIDAKWMMLSGLKYWFLGFFTGAITSFLYVKYSKKGKIERKKKQSKIVLKIKNIISGLWQGLISIKDLQHPYLFVIYTIAMWMCYYLGGYFCFFAFDFLQSLDQISMAAFVVLAVGSIGFMIAQGGLGAYPLIVAGVLVLYGVDYAQGLAAGWIGWTAQTIMILVVGFTTLILSSFLKIEDRKEGELTI